MSAPTATFRDGLGAVALEAAETAGIGVLVLRGSGPQRHHAYVGAGAAALLGYTRDELSESPADAYLDERTLTELERARAEHARGPALVEGRLISKSGARLASRVVAFRFDHAGEDHEIRLLIDARPRLRAEHALSVSRVRFLQLLDAAPDAIAVFGRRQLLYVNPRLLRLLECESAGELAGTPPSELIEQPMLERAKVALHELLAGCQSERILRLRLKSLRGTRVEVECSGLSTEWDGEPACIVVARDLHQRKANLSQQIEADRSTALGTLSAGVAHEINNPLAYVLLNLEYLLRELPQWDGSRAKVDHYRERLEDAQHGAERVVSILRELGSLSTRSGRRRTSVDVCRVMKQAIKQVEPELAGRGRLIEELGEVSSVVGEAGRMEQLFVNLLLNAIQALPADGAGEVRVRAFESERGVVIEVADTGAGIPPEQLGRVFDPFFTTKPVGVGTGLGLPICHAIVRSLAGQIVVESRPGAGTLFRVILPPAPAGYVSLEPPSGAAPESAGTRARVLIIDDEPAVAHMLSLVLEDAHDVEVCTNPEEALDRLLGRSFDIVLCDLLMPRVSGMDLFAALESARPGLEQRLVFMTGGAFTQRASEFLRRVPNERLEKPFDIAEVRSLLARLGRPG